MISVNQQLQDRSIRHAIAIGRFERGLSGDLISYLDAWLLPRLEARMQSRLGRIARMRRDTGVRSTQTLREMMTGLRDITQVWGKGARQMVLPELKRLALAEAEWQAAALRSVLPAVVEITLPAPALLRQIVTEKTINGAFLEDWFKTVERNILNRVTRETNLGLAGGETPDQIIRRLTGTKKLGFRDGIIDATRTEASVMVRTAAAHTAQKASSAVALENADIIKGEEWVATLDIKTCRVCGPRDGKVYPLDGGPSVPAHPNCRCFRVAVTKSWRELGLDVDDLDPVERANMDGKPGVTGTFSEWLKGRDADDVAQVLGSKSAAKAFLAGDVKLSAFSTAWGKPLSLKAAMASG